MNWIYDVLIVCAIASVCALGIAIWVVFIDNKDRQKLKAEKQFLKDEFAKLEEEFHAEAQRCNQAKALLPESLPIWVRQIAEDTEFEIDRWSHNIRSCFGDVSYYFKYSYLDLIQERFDYTRQDLVLLKQAIDNLAAIPAMIKDMRNKASWKVIEALSRVEQVQEFGKAMSDQGIVLDAGIFDTLQSSADSLNARVDTNGMGTIDRSDQILDRAEKLLAHAEEIKRKLEYLAAPDRTKLDIGPETDIVPDADPIVIELRRHDVEATEPTSSTGAGISE